MELSRQALSAYDARLGKLEGAAFEYVSQRVGAYVARFLGATSDEVREFAVECMGQAVAAYGDAAATAAADMYDAMAYASGAKVAAARVAESDAAEHIERAARYQLAKHLEGDSAGFAEACGRAAQEQVARRANQTMAQNAQRDKVRYARVPMGGCCKFCAMMASRGFAYKSASSAGKGVKFHRSCRCKVVPGFDGMKVEGYDPDAWHARWRQLEEIDRRDIPEFDKRALRAALESGDGASFELVEKGMGKCEIAAAKLERYALSPDGDPDKARAFKGYLGYTAEDSATVAAKVYEHVAEHEPEYRDAIVRGDRFTTQMVMEGKEGKSAKVLVGWIREGGAGKMRLTTIHVDE